MFQIEGEVSCGNHVGILNYVNQFWDFFLDFVINWGAPCLSEQILAWRIQLQ